MINLKIQQLHLFTFIKNVTSNIYTCQLWLSYGREFFMGHINLFYVWLRGVIWHTFPMALVYAFNLHNLQKSELLICLKNEIFNICQNLYLFVLRFWNVPSFIILIYQRIGEVASFYISCNEKVKWNFHESKTTISQF